MSHGRIVTGPESGMSCAILPNDERRLVADEFTARAVLAVMAGEDPNVTFILTLRPMPTLAALHEARRAGLGDFLDPLLEDRTFGIARSEQHTELPYVVRQWWAGGARALNLAAKECSDECPF
jgi:hypothetical protein